MIISDSYFVDRDGHYDINGRWIRDKLCFSHCDQCTCEPPNGKWYESSYDLRLLMQGNNMNKEINEQLAAMGAKLKEVGAQLDRIGEMLKEKPEGFFDGKSEEWKKGYCDWKMNTVNVVPVSYDVKGRSDYLAGWESAENENMGESDNG